MSSPKLRWALIGASDIAATRMIPAFRAAGHEVVIVQSGSAEWADAYAGTHGIAYATTSVQSAVDRDDIDAVYVSSHNSRHHEQVIAAALAGKHVLAEKPLALNVSDAQAMVDACAAAGVVMATNHHLPASPTHRTMKRLVADGAVGDVRAVHVSHAVGLPDRLKGWRINDPVGGGVVLDVFIHDMAAVAAIIGGQAITVTARSRAGNPVPDSLMTVVEWDSDVIVQTHDAYDNYDLPTYVEILGTKGAIRSTGCMTGDPTGDVLLFKGHVAESIDVGSRDDLYLTTTLAFARAVDEGTAPLVTGPDGVRSLAAALTAQESLRTGCVESVPRI